MGVYTHSEGNWLTRRGGFLVLLVLFTFLFIAALKSGFAVRLLEELAPPIVAEIINEVKPKDEPPPPPPPKMEIPLVEVPPPVVDISIPMDTPVNTISNVTDRPQPPAPPPVPAPRSVARTKLEYAKGAQPNLQDFYPPASIRNEEEGLVKVNVCVGANGRVKEVSLVETSGIARLDEAGLKMARQYRFKPPTVDGQPVDAACTPMPIRFKLQTVD
jgi:periplasmic protein TonB